MDSLRFHKASATLRCGGYNSPPKETDTAFLPSLKPLSGMFFLQILLISVYSGNR